MSQENDKKIINEENKSIATAAPSQNKPAERTEQTINAAADKPAERAEQTINAAADKPAERAEQTINAAADKSAEREEQTINTAADKTKEQEKEQEKETFNTITFVRTPVKTATIDSNDPVINSQKNLAINAAVKDSDIKQQNENHTNPDTPQESAEKEKNLRNDPSLSAAMDAYTQETNRLKIPDSISKQYIISDDNLLFNKETKKVDIDASNNKILRTKNQDVQTIKNMLKLAKANKWESIKVGGTQEFRREAWAQARAAGIKVQGYTPTKDEKKFIEALINSKINKNPSQQLESEKGQNTIEQRRNQVTNLVTSKIDKLKDYLTRDKSNQTPTKNTDNPKIVIQSKLTEKEIVK